MKPLLAATLNPDDIPSLNYPVVASPKLDGIRCLIADNTAISRSLKPIRNAHVQSWASKWGKELNGLDGELIVGPHDATVFNRTTSEIMSKDGTDNFTFWVFDDYLFPEESYQRRFRGMIERAVDNIPKVKLVPRKLIKDSSFLLDYEQQCLDAGFEGVMIRDPAGRYKYGRSTNKEAILLKLKRFTDTEGTVVGFEERLHNTNPQTKNALGASERASNKEGMLPAGDLGALLVRTSAGVEVSIGSGFTADERHLYWSKRQSLLGTTVKFKYFAQGVKDAPRFPIFLGFRDSEDMS